MGVWVVPGNYLDHSPTILGNVRIVGSVWIVGESINMVNFLIFKSGSSLHLNGDV